MNTQAIKWLQNISFGAAITVLATASATAGTLNIEVDGIEETKGNIMVAVYDNAEYFPSKSDYAVKKIKA